nr:hypothetical protein [Tanacetum cinerariifolium]
RNGNQNQIVNGNLVVAHAEGNAAGQNGNQIRCYNYRGKEEAGIQLQEEVYDLMAAAADLDEIEEISGLNKQLSKEKSTVSFLLEEKKRLKSDFKTYEDKLLDKQIQLEKRIKELNNIVLKRSIDSNDSYALTEARLVLPHRKKMALGYQNHFYLKQAQKKQKSLYDGKVLHEKHDPPVVHDLEETLQLAQESRKKMKQMNKEIKPANYTKINHLSGDTSKNTKFAKQPIVENIPKIGETNALSKPVTSNLVSTPQESKTVNNDKVIAPGIFRINPSKASRKEKCVPNTPNVTKPKKVEHHKSLATPKPRKSRLLLRRSPTGKLFDNEGKIVDSSKSRSQFDCSNGNLKLLINFVWKFLGTVRFRNDHVAAIMGFGQFYDSDLEVAFRKDACFIRNMEGVDLLKGDRSKNLYTINLHEMASASPICLMARASSTKSWLWH